MILSKFDRLLRWGVLVSVLLNIVFNYLSVQGKINGATIEEVTLQYEHSFTPAGFTFSIWSVIYLSFIIYSIYQLLPVRKGNAVYTLVAPSFIGVNLLGMLWLTLYSYDFIGLSVLVIFAMFLLGFFQFRCIKFAIQKHHTKKWISVPFSLFFGWISIAALANFSTWIVSVTGQSTPIYLSMFMIFLAVFAAVFITVRYRDWIYPLVVCWACIGIWSATRDFYNQIASMAGGACVLLITWIAVYALIHFFKSQRLEY